MSVTTGVSHVEMGFALGALILTVMAGFVIVPAIRRAMADPPETERRD